MADAQRCANCGTALGKKVVKGAAGVYCSTDCKNQHEKRKTCEFC